MPRLTSLILTLLIVIAFGASLAVASGDWRAETRPASDDDKPDYAPIVERRMDFYDFTYQTVAGHRFDLRDYATGKRLIVVAYFAGWCANSNRNGHVVERLWKKYRGRGLGIVGVAEYSDVDELRIHINRIGIEYPVVIETRKRGDRKDSSHFKYRRAAGDKRRWGTPFYVIIEARDIEPLAARQPLVRRVFTISGEIVESEAEQFIEQRLSRSEGR